MLCSCYEADMYVLCSCYVIVYVVVTDLLGDNAAGQGAALGFQYYGGPIVTVLASKTSSKYMMVFSV